MRALDVQPSLHKAGYKPKNLADANGTLHQTAPVCVPAKRCAKHEGDGLRRNEYQPKRKGGPKREQRYGQFCREKDGGSDNSRGKLLHCHFTPPRGAVFGVVANMSREEDGSPGLFDKEKDGRHQHDAYDELDPEYPWASVSILCFKVFGVVCWLTSAN